MSDNTTNMTEKDAQSYVGTYAVHQYRDWSGEHRIMHKVAAPFSLPPAHSGKRVSKNLSDNAARKMADSCEYVSMKKGGYSTFLTLTFNSSTRRKIRKGKTTIQKEASRFFDSLQKVYARGWDCEFDNGDFERVEGKADKLDYLWVAENPVTCTDVDIKTGVISDRRDNPHLHVLLRWEVDYKYFKAWSERIEKVWGNGFAHLEKLKSRKRETAAAYLMKALKYIAKAVGGSDQGVIEGNRYGISKSARAPQWETLYTFAWCKLGQLIERARFKQNQKRKPLEQMRNDLKDQLEQATTKQQKSAIQKALEKTREKIEKEKGGIYYGRNRVLCKGHDAKDRLFNWFESMGFEWYKKPLSLYSEILRKKQLGIDEYMHKWHEHTNRLGWENRIPEWWAAVAKHRELSEKLAWF
ncbi:MAG: hypothetical protein QM500_04095 [Methylococcales bacterium]